MIFHELSKKITIFKKITKTLSKALPAKRENSRFHENFSEFLNFLQKRRSVGAYIALRSRPRPDFTESLDF